MIDATCLEEINVELVNWLWKNLIPYGELTIVEGDPSTNKSTMTLDLAAGVSTGSEMPDGTTGDSGTVVLFTTEDSVSKTIKPRLLAANADMAKIFVSGICPVLPEEIRKIEKIVKKYRPKLIIFDPISAYIGPDSSGDQRVRKALRPLQQLADRHDAAIVLIRHLSKRSGGKSMYRGLGSVGIVASSRSALLVGKCPDDDSKRVLCQIKSNLGPLSPSILFEPTPNPNGSISIDWQGWCDYTPEDLHKPTDSGNRKLELAKHFLMTILADGPIKQTNLAIDAEKQGISLRTLERAKQTLNISSNRTGWGPGSFTQWSISEYRTPNMNLAFYGMIRLLKATQLRTEHDTPSFSN